MLDLSVIGIAMETSGLEKGTAALKTAEQAANKTADAADKVTQSSRLMGAGQRDAAAATDKTAQAIEKQLSALRQQVTTFGMSAQQATVYKLAMEGATDAQLKQAEASLKQIKGLEDAGVMGRQMGTAIKAGAVLAVAAVVATTYAFESLIGNVAKYQDLAEKTGGDPAGLASLRTAADVGGSSVESLSMALNRMQLSLSRSSDESKGAGKALAAIGISIEDFKKLKGDEQLRVLGKALNEYADSGGKVAVVQAIMGRGAASMLPTLKELGNETEKLNGLTTEQIRLADDYKDAQTRVISELKQLAESMAVPLLPVVTEFIGALKDTAEGLIGVDAATSDLAKNTKLVEWGNDVVDTFAFVVDAGLSVISATKMVGATLGWLAARALPGEAGKTREQRKGSAKAIDEAYLEDLERYRKGTSLMRDAVEARRAIQAKAEAQFKDPRILGEVGSIAEQTKKNLEFISGPDPKTGGRSASAAERAAKAAQKAIEDAIKSSQKAAQEHAAIINKERDGIDAYMNAEKERLQQTARGAENAVRAAQDEYDNHGKLASVIAETTLKRLQDQLVTKTAGTDAYESVTRQIEAQKQLIGIMQKGEGRDADKKATDDREKVSKDFAEGLHTDLKGALSAAFRDTKNPLQAFGDALGNVIFTRVSASLADALATQILGSSGSSGSSGAGIIGFFASLFNANGNAFDSGGVKGFANGGAFHNSVLTEATPFKFANGGRFSQAVAGEAGPEAVMPLTRGANGKLGVQASGNQQTVSVTYNMTVGDVASASMVRQAIAGSEKRIAAGIGRSMSYGGAMS